MKVDIKTLQGLPMANDRFWLIDTGDFTAFISEYNDELTGFDARLAEIDKGIFHYGGNAYYITGDYARCKGWRIMEVSRQS
jgi:hypothetical protein